MIELTMNLPLELIYRILFDLCGKLPVVFLMWGLFYGSFRLFTHTNYMGSYFVAGTFWRLKIDKQLQYPAPLRLTLKFC